MSTKRRTLGVHSSPQPKGLSGERLCRNCLKPLPKGARFNCSSACSQEWMGKTSPAHMRYLLKQRDREICARCGVSCMALKREYLALPHAERAAYAQKCGIPVGRWGTDWWDADHIVPVIEGGGECGIENSGSVYSVPRGRDAGATPPDGRSTPGRKSAGTRPLWIVRGSTVMEALAGPQLHQSVEHLPTLW